MNEIILNPLVVASIIGFGIISLCWVLIKTRQDFFWLVLAVIFSLPFERIPSIPVGDFSLKINHILGTILIICYFINLLKKREKIKINYLTLPLLGFLFFISVSIFQSKVPVKSLITLCQIIFVMLLLFIVSNEFDSEEKAQKVFKIIKISSGLVILFAFYQFLGDMIGIPNTLTGLRTLYTKEVFGFPRVQSFLIEPLYLGNYLFLPLSVFTADILKGKKTLVNVFGFILISIVIFMTLSRGAILAYAIFIILLVFFYPKKTLTIKNLSHIVTILSVAILIVVAIFSYLGEEKRASYINQLTLKDYQITDSVMGRLNTYSIAWMAFIEKPLTGIGLFNYGPYSTGYNLDDRNSETVVNNEYLEILAETGIFGFTMFISIIVLILFATIKALKNIKKTSMKTHLIILTFGFVAILIQYNFFSTLAIIYIWVYIGLLVGLQGIVGGQVMSKFKSQSSNSF